MAKATEIKAIPELVKAVRKAFQTGKTRTLSWRQDQLKCLSKMMDDNEAKISEALKSDLGANEFFIKVLEFGLVRDEINLALTNLEKWMNPKKVGTPALLHPASSYIMKEPLGSVLIISAWNYPLGVLLIPLVSAIAAGNTVVLKPSEVSVNVCNTLSELIPKYMDTDCIKVVNGGVKETTCLLKEKFDLCFYTGNTNVGKIIMEACSKNLCPVVLELGGQCPAIVSKETDLVLTARRLLWGKFTMNMGQTCVSPNHVFIEEEIFDALVDQLKKTLVEFFGENPKESTDVQRIINTNHCNRLQKIIEEDDSIQVLVGNDVNIAEKYFSPTLVKASVDSPCIKGEIFGPILPLVPVKTIREAIDTINSRDKPLAAYVFTKSKEIEELVVSNVSAGGMSVNDIGMHVANPCLPFGGVGSSGFGVYHGKHGFNTFSHKKSILYRKQWTDDPSIRYPPFDETKVSRYLTVKKISDYLPCSIQ